MIRYLLWVWDNPKEFISKAISVIREEKATMIVEHIAYNRTKETYDGGIFTTHKTLILQRRIVSRKMYRIMSLLMDIQKKCGMPICGRY